MRTIAIAALALVAAPGLALAAAPSAPVAPPSLAGLAADPELEGKVQVAITQQRLEAGGTLAEHRQPYIRHLFIVSGQLKVSNLVTGEEQLVGAGEIATEAAGDWHLARAVGDEAVEIFVIDQLPAEETAASAGGL
ncbi:cupin domain-containing protein [Phenylobacterium sp.]|jgi:quercetin dioxygenase-like cupin family protein|uniref:cupin domain-containing protein n=1 Tax=Phenylobacterium sp. TaxID=1871053 RepID=UPI002E309B46|nr:cupin domain-containing protein [Phenylobacterium sp.]HEX2559555.1 cupin domain-containing protein [Phenylobacterium sp.]